MIRQVGYESPLQTPISLVEAVDLHRELTHDARDTLFSAMVNYPMVADEADTTLQQAVNGLAAETSKSVSITWRFMDDADLKTDLLTDIVIIEYAYLIDFIEKRLGADASWLKRVIAPPENNEPTDTAPSLSVQEIEDRIAAATSDKKGDLQAVLDSELEYFSTFAMDLMRDHNAHGREMPKARILHLVNPT